MIKKIHLQLRGDKQPDSLRLPWMRVSSATAYFYDNLYERNSMSLGDLRIQSKYLDAMIPMAYLSSDDAGRFSLDRKVEEIIIKVEGEVETAPTVVGINANNFDSFVDTETVENALWDHFGHNPNFRGVCLFEFDKLYGEFAEDQK